MNDIFLLLTLLSILALIVGIIRPNLVIRWGNPETRNRKKVLKVYILSIIVTFILFGMTIPETDTSKDTLDIEKQEIVSEVSSKEKPKKKKTKRQIEKEEELKEEERKKQEEKEELEKEAKLAKEKEEKERLSKSQVKDVNYRLMWRDYKNDEYTDKYIRIAGKVDYVGEKSINIKEGLEGITANIYLTFEDENIDQLKNLSEGDYIVATGKASGKLAGQISVKNSNIELTGKEAMEKENEYKKIADKLSEKAIIEEEKLRKQKMDEYKIKAKSVKYEDLIRNPHNYKGQILQVTIKVSQIMGGGILTQPGYAGKQGNNEWFINYKLPENSTRILENDTVRFYGEFEDVVKMKRALTKTEVYIPKLDAKYFEIIK